MSVFYPLKVQSIQNETKDSVSISFLIPENISETFTYKPGQYLSLRFTIDGKEYRRSYSLCSSPYLKELPKIAIKRVENGLISNYINDKISVGDSIDVMPPEGRFYAEIKANNYKTYYLFSAGSGITPILSILKSILFKEERSFVYMLYGNRHQESIMFNDDLTALQKQFKHRFVLEHVLSKPARSWSELWKSTNEFNFKKGRIDSKLVQSFINENPPYAQNTAYFICGPGSMIDNIKSSLKELDVPADRIFSESFGAEIKDSGISGIKNAKLIARLNHSQVELTISKGKTILQALIENGQEPPYSCEAGVCSTCVCTLKQGEVHMKNNLALDEKEVDEGLILSCQSIPLSETIEVEYSP